jgi:hypothetical protein
MQDPFKILPSVKRQQEYESKKRLADEEKAKKKEKERQREQERAQRAARHAAHAAAKQNATLTDAKTQEGD